jgi:6-pyruvoyltetrahydropterin/6-carboxytetrahydropterin synthase
MRYASTKTYGHEIGLSACFRQWRAESQCHFLHGYALSFRFEFEARKLDQNNWVVDFGALKPLRFLLEQMFDHKLLIAEDDPKKEELLKLNELGLAQVVIVPNVGCEAFAQMGCEIAEAFLDKAGLSGRVMVKEVEVREHGANSAIYRP